MCRYARVLGRGIRQYVRVTAGAREVWLRDEIARLAMLIDAPAQLIVGFDPGIDMGSPYVEVEPGGPYHWIVKERGQTLEHRTTTDVDDVLFWSFESTTSSMASSWAARNPSADEDFRGQYWKRQHELLGALSPAWVARWRHRLSETVPDAMRFLPTQA